MPKKAASRKPAKKKSLAKKSPPREKAAKKKATKKRALKKKTAKKLVIKKAEKKAPHSRKQEAPPQPLIVEPGPPPRPLPSLEEPATNEVAIGTITHYYSHLSVAVAQ